MDALGWRKFYESAVLETDDAALPQRLAEAHQAVQARLQALNMDHGGTPEEQDQLKNALRSLETLRKERLPS